MQMAEHSVELLKDDNSNNKNKKKILNKTQWK